MYKLIGYLIVLPLVAFIGSRFYQDENISAFEFTSKEKKSVISEVLVNKLADSNSSSVSHINPPPTSIDNIKRPIQDNLQDKQLNTTQKNKPGSYLSRWENIEADIPFEHHSIFKWRSGNDEQMIDKKMVDEYSNFNNQQQDNELNDELEQVIISFIYQHEQGAYIHIDKLSCYQNQCEIFGSQEDSISWGEISQDIENTPWWTFKQTTSNGTSESGRQVFMTLIQ